MAKHYPIVLDGTTLKELPTGDGLSLLDNEKLTFGADSDLQIYHDGSHTYIDEQGTGDLQIRGNNLALRNASGEAYVRCTSDDWVKLYHNDAEKLATTSTGIDVTGTITADGLDMEDNQKILLGASDDLQIWHNGTHSYIKDNGTGDLRILAGNLVMMNSAGTETFLTGVENGAVTLYYDNSSKFNTNSNGVTVTGRAKGTQTTDNDGTFDLNASNHFVCTPTANFTLTFTNHTAGQAGTIILINSGGYTVSAASTTKVMGADLLTTITTAGTYVIGYISDGTNTRIYNSGIQQ